MTHAAMEIRHSNKGYYILLVNGVFMGNFDTVSEAVIEFEELDREKEELEVV